jgi:hypothetical protein
MSNKNLVDTQHFVSYIQYYMELDAGKVRTFP